ncbi:unnamed protein product, partial [Mesorhabditis belari]|uniref:Protein Wnt n=1 Tax=Mesorhabditis belari TaxID=2138241 RepID=A0AAF3EPS4_9BILA
MMKLLLLLLMTLLLEARSWWLLSELSPGLSSFHPSTCLLIPGFNEKQKEICTKNADAMNHVVSGLRMAVDECQKTFSTQLWNCSISARQPQSLQTGSKESAYVYAIASAGMSHSIAKACSKGEISACSCGPIPSTQTNKYIWAGCSDNVRYANTFGRKFIDVTDKEQSDARSLMNLHNNRVGRRLLSNSMKKECKCHGVSGSCVTKTCWKVVPQFDDFALKLKEKYDFAQQAILPDESVELLLKDPPIVEGARVGRYLDVDKERNRVPKNDLVYLETSPDYCQKSTRGRECTNNCRTVCCGRGWNTVREMVEEPCQCKFIWCCEVECKTCRRLVEKNYCR